MPSPHLTPQSNKNQKEADAYLRLIKLGGAEGGTIVKAMVVEQLRANSKTTLLEGMDAIPTALAAKAAGMSRQTYSAYQFFDDGRALKKEQLAAECKIDPSRLYKPGGIKELMDLEKVDNKRGVGYFRLDAPPPNAVDLE